MVSMQFPLRLGAIFLGTALAVGILGCSGSKGSNSTEYVTLTGKVTYTRVPLLKDANGVPTGLETNSANFTKLPARGIQLRVFQSKEETNPDGTKATVWTATSSSIVTDSTGSYSVQVPRGNPTFVELLSKVPGAGTALPVRIIADPAGINSTVPQPDRLLYSMRKGVDGSSPAGNYLPATVASANATVNFDVGLTDAWWLVNPRSDKSPVPVMETSGSGSRILAIADSIYAFEQAYGDAVPSKTAAQTLDLHYKVGLSEPQGTFVEYEPRTYPHSYDGAYHHYFGSLRGGADNDDAWDEGVLFPLLARNNLVAQGYTPLLPVKDSNPAHLVSLRPDLALVEGFADTMAAVLLQSPYLADTKASGITVRDVRDLGSLAGSQLSMFSAPAIRTFAWDLVLKANSLPSPGTPTDWAKIVSTATTRFFTRTIPTDSSSNPTDISNLYVQLGRLQESKSSSDTVDLKTIFTDGVLTAMLSPYNVVWPRPTTGSLATFLTDLGADPNTLGSTAVPNLAWSMAGAFRDDTGVFPNVSAGEEQCFRFTLSKDMPYNLSVGSAASLPDGASVQIVLNELDDQTYTFDRAHPGPIRIVLTGNSTTPVPMLLRARFLSPNILQPDLATTLRLDLAN